ncbi:hypothetical protein BOX15_Mlig003920g1 [Macrostomum lignano]|uniref:Lipase domain-containing protein n=1 Tax=Macrostomum lignano TaxID=282301 RepID=A0A267GXC2_9PLAT|nr:hypothetical protein BOX15_Mlig003920g1 [Macrostomum lignano]
MLVLMLGCTLLLFSAAGRIDANSIGKRFVPQKICYDGLGCFSTGGNFYDLWNRPIQLLPQSPDHLRPTYALFTLRNPMLPQILRYGDKASIEKSNFNPKLPTKMVIHGFVDDINVPWVGEMKKALLLHGDHNVVLVDWSKGNQLPYTQATANTRVVGALIAQLIMWLETQFGANREQFHLLGHSLGSHIAGYAGERLTGSRRLGRITGMDPAGPYFENTHPEVRLDPTDARFVDAIHTDGDSLLNSIKLQGGMGLMQPVGHVDFYPNGGKKQPDCSQNPITGIIINGIVEGTKWVVACYHMRVLQLVSTTLIHAQGDYKAFPCDSYENFKAGKCAGCGITGCAQMGIRAAEWNPSGLTNVKMFLDTDGHEPYEMHHYFAKIIISGVSSAKQQYGDLFLTLEGADGQSSSQLTVVEKSYMEPGELISIVLTGTDPVFDLKRLTVSWKHRWNLAILKQKLHVNRVEIVEGFKEKRSLFCAGDVAIESGKSLSLVASPGSHC